MKRLFFVQCNPRGQGRPRFSGNVAYKTSEDKAYEQGIHMAYRAAYPGAEPIHGPCKVVINALYPIPKRTSKRQREQMLEGIMLPIVRPDIDNIYKAVLDALNGVAYDDDKQVVEGEMRKYYGEKPGLLVEIEEVIHGKTETLPVLHGCGCASAG